MTKRTLRNIALSCFIVAVSITAGEFPVNKSSLAQTADYRISGTILNANSSKPFKGLIVKLFSTKAPGSRPLASTNTDFLGRYELKVKLKDVPEVSQPQGRQKFFVRVFTSNDRVVKSSAEAISVKISGTTLVDIRLRHSEVFPNIPDAACLLGKRSPFSPIINRLSSKELVDLLILWNQNLTPFTFNLNQAQQELFELLSQENPTDDCTEGLFSAIKNLLEKRGDFAEVKRLADALKSAFFEKQFVTENIVVRYHTTGNSAVYSPIPTTDCPLRLPNGILIGYIRANVPALPRGNTHVPPIYVQQVGLIAEYAYRRFTSPPFSLRDPREGTPPRIEVRLQRISDGTGHTDPDPDYTWIDIRPDNSLDQNFATVPHELFHRVQYQYNRTANRSGLHGVFREGGASFAEDSFNDDYNRYVFRSQELFINPAHSLVSLVDDCDTPISYAAGLFWKYLAEQHSRNIENTDEPDIGIDVYRELLLTMATPTGSSPTPYNPASLREACLLMARPGNFDEFQYFDPAKTELSSTETTWGNYLVANRLHGSAALPVGERRFKYLEDQERVTWPDLPTISTLASLTSTIARENDVILAGGSTHTLATIGQLSYAARYYRITPDSSSPPRMLRVSFSAFGGMTDPLIQMLRFGPDGVLTDISKSDRPSYTKTVNMNGVSSVVVIVASRMNAGDYTVNFDEVPGGSDVMITRWNSALGTEYELNPRDWTRTSPDLIVDSNNDGVPDAAVTPGVNNRLKVRVHNRGNMSISGVRIDLEYQPANTRLNPSQWRPVQNAANVTQSITNLASTPGQSNWSEVDWAPTASASGWCVKATVHAPGDLNTDNKIAIGCFNRSL